MPFAGIDLRFVSRWLFYSLLVGVVAGLGAVVFFYLLQLGNDLFLHRLAGYIPPGPAGEGGAPGTGGPFGFGTAALGLLLAPVLGGLLSGLLVYTWAPEAEGHGTDAMIEAFHHHRGVIRPRVVPIKTLASALTIGSGGSAGREGPIAQIGAGFGSVLATVLRLSDRDRRILMLAGAAAGIGAIFRAPLGGALIGTEVLYSEAELEYEALVPSLIASVVAYSIFGSLFGWTPLFAIPRFTFEHPLELLFYGTFGLLCAVIGRLYVAVFYGSRDHFFRHLPFPHGLRPAFGGLLVGLLALGAPGVLGAGYGWVQQAIDGKLAWEAMGALTALKILATSFTISSGGSGGVFGPSVIIGGLLGGAFGHLAAQLFPALITQPAAFVIVGMGGFFAGIAKVPLGSILMVSEMTGGYALLVPLMLVAVLATLFTGHARLYEKQVPTRLDSPAHQGEFLIDVLAGVRVRDVLRSERPLVTFKVDTLLQEVLPLAFGSSQLRFPCLDGEGRLIGMLDLDDLRRLHDLPDLGPLARAYDVARPVHHVLSLDETLTEALGKFVDSDAIELPVVDPPDSRQVVGLLARREILHAYDRAMAGHRARG